MKPWTSVIIMALSVLVPAAAQAADTLPHEVDLRPEFARLGITPKSQGARGCCSLFAIIGVLEFEYALAGKPARLSEEYLNWASHQTNARRTDGSFFSDAVRGVAVFGICREDLWPYAAKYDADAQPPAAAAADAQTRRSIGAVWIKHWDVKTGMTEEMLTAMRASLVAGHPIALGMRWPNQEQYGPGHTLLMPPEGKVFDGHSIFLVGYRDDPAQPGGGTFIFRNHAGPNWGEGGYGRMPYAYAAAYGNDALGLRLEGGEAPLTNRSAVAALEIENLPVLAARGCQASLQDMTQWGGALWSGGKHLFCSARAGATLALRLPVAAAGQYSVDLYATHAPDFGIIRVSLDGKPLGENLDLYRGEVAPSGKLALGVTALTVGEHALSFEVVGKNGASGGCHFGLDCLELRARE
jgi:hypothetical protein